MSDNVVNLEKYKEYIKLESFASFNFMKVVRQRFDAKLMMEKPLEDELDEITLLKISCDRVLLKFVDIVKDLVDCKNILEKIIMEGLNGYLVIENDDLIFYSVYRFMARDGSHSLYQGMELI